MSRLAVPFVSFVLVFTVVSLVSGGTLSGERVGGGYAAQWFAGCSLGSTGPHQCLSGRADHLASYCGVDSTGGTSMVQNCDECYCNSLTGVNNHYCRESGPLTRFRHQMVTNGRPGVRGAAQACLNG